MKKITKGPLLIACFCLFSSVHAAADWFEDFKDSASPAELHAFLYAMPKGGDLHLHLSGSILSEWFYEHALAQKARGYSYYAKVRIENCASGIDSANRTNYLLLYKTIDHLSYAKLDECQRSEYEPLESLTGVDKERWLDGLRLDEPFEGRNEFFERNWARMGDLSRNPYLVADVFAEHVLAMGEEGLLYMEPQVPIGFGMVRSDGEAVHPDEAVALYRARLAQPDVRKAGVTVRMQVSLLRFLPQAEEALKLLYRFAHKHDDVVAVNMVGREDNDKGYPLRFLPTLRELRRQYSGVRLSIHAGEVDEPNHHVRDTLLLGAERIGHGVNLITDPETLTAMRYGPYLVEINLVSNLLLEYVSDYSQHPFPEYLRLGVPVALSTDDRGMWDSTMTDEFFVAVTEFDLSWQEIKTLSRNSLAYGFVEEDVKRGLLAEYDTRIRDFERRFQRKGADMLSDVAPLRLGFICRYYQLCPEENQ